MAVHIKYPSIEQYRNVIRQVTDYTRYSGKDENGLAIFDPTKKLPVITFIGKVKLHGTNAAIVSNLTSDEYWCQSRERIIDPLSDNAGFATYVHANREYYIELLNTIKQSDLANTELYSDVAIFGEWSGSGVQKGVAIAQLPKMFVVFGIKLTKKNATDYSYWLNDDEVNQFIISNPDMRLYNINDFPQYKIDIDFNHPEIAQSQIVQWVNEVEEECPVGKHFGVSGTGEGLVFTGHDIGNLRFKVKGQQHSVSKVKTLAPIDIEKVNSINELCTQILTENRLEQGLTWLTENQHAVDVKSTGAFLKWVVNDCLKEELDTIVGSGFEVKEVTPKLSAIARTWYFEYLNKQVGL
jgi:hypothetical protein